MVCAIQCGLSQVEHNLSTYSVSNHCIHVYGSISKPVSHSRVSETLNQGNEWAEFFNLGFDLCGNVQAAGDVPE